MGVVRNVAIVVLSISFLTFVAFFGRVPAFRNTPIGVLHRVVWIHVPGALRKADQSLTRGHLSAWVTRQAHTLWNDRHPLVMIFFILLLSVSEVLFLSQAWALLTTLPRLTGLLLITLPYIFLYLAASTDPGYITTSNHAQAMTLYPYDHIIYHPSLPCSTCLFPKPARSKHCSICKHCISKLDHHCIFINSCVGYNNAHYFLLLLFSTGILTLYGSALGFSLLSSTITAQLPHWSLRSPAFTLSQQLTILAWVLQEQTRIGAITLLALLTSPLILGLLAYHLYLLWAGTTTNETMKWTDKRAEMSSGLIFTRSLPATRARDLAAEPVTTWPVESQQVVVRTEDGVAPRAAWQAQGEGEWERVWNLGDVENVYDVGLWDNLRDVFLPRRRVRPDVPTLKVLPPTPDLSQS